MLGGVAYGRRFTALVVTFETGRIWSGDTAVPACFAPSPVVPPPPPLAAGVQEADPSVPL